MLYCFVLHCIVARTALRRLAGWLAGWLAVSLYLPTYIPMYASVFAATNASLRSREAPKIQASNH